MAKTHIGDTIPGIKAEHITGGNFNFASERQETPPVPMILIPFPRDDDFVARGTILEQVEQSCAGLGRRAALVGLGGIGKSQLAIEYAYGTHNQSPKSWVFWVHASNAARFEEGFRGIANCVKIPGPQSSQEEVFRLVQSWLRDCKEQWLLVLDNVDDADFLVEKRALRSDAGPTAVSKPLREYLPHCEHGSILVTTRYKNSALQLVEQERNILAVEPMDISEGVALLKKKVRKQELDDSGDAADLVAALEKMPLAIVQAAAYISKMSPRYSVGTYLTKFKNGSEHTQTRYLNRNTAKHNAGMRRDWEAENAILRTWQISFDHIEETLPFAADLLSLMSFFDRQAIPERLLRSPTEHQKLHSHQTDVQDVHEPCDSEDTASQSSTSDDGFEEAVEMLKSFYFISINQDKCTFEMHALVQLAMREWLERHSKLEQWKHQFISNLYAAFPHVGYHENWAACQALYAHVKSAAKQKPEGDPALVEWATLLYRAADYAIWKGSAPEAEQLATKSMKARQDTLGKDDEDTWESMAMLSEAYSLGGQWAHAAELQVQVMEARIQKLGEDHPDTLDIKGRLGSTCRLQGLLQEAKKLQSEVVHARLRKSKDDLLERKSMEESMENLSIDGNNTYSLQGVLHEAEKLHSEVVHARLRKSKDDLLERKSMEERMGNSCIDGNQEHRDKAEARDRKLMQDFHSVMASMHNLALTFQEGGDWDEAKDLQEKVVKFREDVFGADKIETINSLSNLAVTYHYLGRFSEAAKLQERVVKVTTAKLGKDNYKTLISTGNLAMTYQRQGLSDDAEKLQAQVVQTIAKELGENHPYTLQSKGDIAVTYRFRRQYGKAEPLLLQVCETSRETMGKDHPQTLVRMSQLTSLYIEQEKWDEAQVLGEEVLQKRKIRLGESHPSTLTSKTNLGVIHMELERFADAEELFAQVMKAERKDHPDNLNTMYCLSVAWKRLGRDSAALDLMRECVQRCRQIRGADPPQLVWALDSVAEWEKEAEQNAVA